METPFSKRFKQLSETKSEVKAYSPVQKPADPFMGDMPLLGDVRTKSPEEIARTTERTQIQTQMEDSQGAIQQAAAQLRQQVQSGQISQEDAEHQLDLVINKLVDNSYIGYGDMDMRERAAGFGDNASEAYGMFSMGLDPSQMAKQQTQQEAVTGIMGGM